MTTCCTPFEDDDEYWLEQRLEKTERMIESYENAITELSAGTVVQYSLDTGQTRQSVTKAQLPSLMNTLKLLEQRRSDLRARLGKGTGGATVVIPAF